MKICANCGADVRYVSKARGWIHADPLAELRVSHWEAQDVHADPPPPHQELTRQTYLHPAQPDRRYS